MPGVGLSVRIVFFFFFFPRSTVYYSAFSKRAACFSTFADFIQVCEARSPGCTAAKRPRRRVPRYVASNNHMTGAKSLGSAQASRHLP
eukprot:1742030-Prymnesium_polylepis.1